MLILLLTLRNRFSEKASVDALRSKVDLAREWI